MKPQKIKRVDKPFAHFLVDSAKQIHGWYSWKYRECTSERLLINPYNGCSIGCFYCYTQSFRSFYFQQFYKKRSIFVFNDFDKVVSRQLASLSVASCAYISAVTDPFQKINKYYRLSEKIIKVFIDLGLPVDFITKEKVPEEVISIIRGHPHSFGQVSILTTKDNLRRKLAPEGAGTKQLFNNIYRLKKAGVYAVCRIDPILPYINDNEKELEKIVKTAAKAGANHIIASVLDIPYALYNYFLKHISRLFGMEMRKKYILLYTEKFSYLNAKIEYRRRIFSILKDICRQHRLTFALCMEFERKEGKAKGLNQYFATALNCEGKDTPIYIRRGKKFYSVSKCRGNCLSCDTPYCGIEELAYKKTGKPLALKLSDYRRFSRRIAN